MLSSNKPKGAWGKIPQINKDKYSGCMLDHAPVGSSRADYCDLRKKLAIQHGYGDPVDVSNLDDDVIIAVQQQCVKLRMSNKQLPIAERR